MPFALITGASKGIGKAIAKQLALKGYDLLLVARSTDLLNQTAEELKNTTSRDCRFLSIDLALPDSAKEVYDWCFTNKFEVSVLVNNAGYGLSGRFDKYNLQEHRDMIQVNITTLVELTSLFLPELKKQAASYILNIGSTAAYQAVPLLSAYAASKSFVLSFSRGLYHELKDTTVSVTCVCPGPTDTNFVRRANIGAKGQKAAERFNMTPEAVALIAVKGLFAKKPEVITGGLNKLNAFASRYLPGKLVESIAKKLYD